MAASQRTARTGTARSWRKQISFYPETQREHDPSEGADIFILDFWPPELCENTFLWCQDTHGPLLRQPQETNPERRRIQ